MPFSAFLPSRLPEMRMVDFICQGRAFRGGKWLPWHTIAAAVYENRKRCPRTGYQVRLVAIAATGESHG